MNPLVLYDSARVAGTPNTTGIEVAPPDYWAYCNSYEDAVFYCFMLKIDSRTDWRLPFQQMLNGDLFRDEEAMIVDLRARLNRQECCFWVHEDRGRTWDEAFFAIPVRDLIYTLS